MARIAHLISSMYKGIRNLSIRRYLSSKLIRVAANIVLKFNIQSLIFSVLAVHITITYNRRVECT